MVRVVILHLFIGDIGVCIPGGGGVAPVCAYQDLALGLFRCAGSLIFRRK